MVYWLQATKTTVARQKRKFCSCCFFGPCVWVLGEKEIESRFPHRSRSASPAPDGRLAGFIGELGSSGQELQEIAFCVRFHALLQLWGSLYRTSRFELLRPVQIVLYVGQATRGHFISVWFGESRCRSFRVAGDGRLPCAVVSFAKVLIAAVVILATKSRVEVLMLAQSTSLSETDEQGSFFNR